MPTKRDNASGVVVDRHRISGSQTEPSADDVTHPLDNASRRNFLRRTGTLAGGALATSVSLAHADPLAIQESNKAFGTLAQVQMPNRNGFIIDDRPDTKAVRCMTNCR